MKLVSKVNSVRISGIGGQGNVIMGIILASALVEEGYYVVQTQSYGAQVRGGLSFSDVIFSREEIDYPKSENFDIIYAMHQLAVSSHYDLLKKNGILIIDKSYVKKIPKEIMRATRKIISEEITNITKEKLFSTLPANMVGLGIIAKVSHILSLESVKISMKKYMKEKYHRINEEAIELGYKLVNRSYYLKNDDREYISRGFE
ncbi:MAG: 2-oxoglutarate ferredoxin oxidoreductase subunit gamma [Kosmotogales bacterium]|nr:2-oxoglutarate ferredoxin oxidoreductase subunit gamma [Kosmotogales bacterium]